MKSSSASPEVCIILVNWNGWQDTIECLETLFRLDYPAFRVIVCENGSSDGSLEKLRAWAEGRLAVAGPANPALQRLFSSPLSKPIPFVEYDRPAAESGGRPDEGGARLVLIRTGANLGFAGGNNVALRYCLARGGFAYAWLLNNDTVAEPNALTCLVERMQSDSRVGLCGSTILFYEDPRQVQALGGSILNSWTGHGRGVGVFEPFVRPGEAAPVESQMTYVSGASMMVGRDFLEEVGLLSEDYFLYFEEADWARRARGKYGFGYAPGSIIYHKEGRAVGSDSGGAPSVFSRYYFFRSALRFTRRYHAVKLPAVLAFLVLLAFRQILRGRTADGRALIRLVLGRGAPRYQGGRRWSAP